MGRQEHQGRGEQAILHSSIALLQERFRQLQKVKEMRQERELLMSFSSSMDSVGRGRSIPTHLDQQQPGCFIQSGLFYPNPATRPHHAAHNKATRPLWSAGDQYQQFPKTAAAGYSGAPPLSMDLLPNWAVATNMPLNYAEDKDVDTSLHL